MKHLFLFLVLFSSPIVFAQEEMEQMEESLLITSIENHQDYLLLNEKLKLHKGDEIQVYLPANGKDFLFVEKKKGFFAQNIGGIADVVSSGAGVVGVSSNSIGTIRTASQVMRTADAVKYGADALENIQSLNISKKAKKLAGKKFTITGWSFEDDGYILNGKIENKDYLIYLQEAVVTGEVKLQWGNQ